jgi:hypothetical protein
MDYKKTETEIIEATKEFATINNIHYDELTESMILNAMRELNECFIADVVVPKGTLCRCECEMPYIDGRQGLCGRCERPIIA